MAEQSKRSSQLESGYHSHRGKNARAQAMPNGVVKQELPDVGEVQQEDEQEEQEEGEVSQGSCSRTMVAVEAMETEPQINLSSHGQACGGAAIYSPCVEVDAFVRDAKQPCAHEEFGCESSVVYFEAADHRRACQWAPCWCPDPGCGYFSLPARLVDHFAAAHSWPVTEVCYGKPHRLALLPPQGWHVLVGQGDRCVFLLSPCALGKAAAVALVCVRANGGAAEGAPQFRCKLWAEAASRTESMTMMMSVVGSSNLSGGFSAAVQDMFLVVPPEILHDVSGEAPFVMVRIDRTGAAAAAAAAAAAKSTTPTVRSSRRTQ
ncbi:hypothetical protein C2845_PM07G02580 [Panicum miliaceum]|uniref:SIAH-type domain-containing protein n=1 Tax=Panicum miliaceum TaxID=4540 RepID=A0A3L6SRQ6_PANMI|nr:hypothetical protein C2845_PM07G02580 [Panicum miliaceum]